MTKVKRPVGRPTLYNTDVQAQAEQYLLEDYKIEGGVIPSVAGLACYLGVSRSTIHEWRDRHPEFSGTLDAIEQKQEFIVVNRGLTGDFNATITKLVLANHGYSDKIQTDHTSSDGSLKPVTRIELVAPTHDDP